MEALGDFLAELSPPYQFLMAAVFLVLVWFLVRRSNRLRPYMGQLLVLAGVFWIGLLFFLISYSFPAPRGIMASVTDATTIPRVWFYVLIPTIVLALIPIIRGKNDPDPKWGNMKRLALVVAALVIGLGLINFIGYYISMALVVFAIMWLLGSRSKIELATVPVGWILFSYLVFARLLHVRLPVGRIFSGFVS